MSGTRKLFCLGVSHQTAHVGLRERIAVSDSSLSERLAHWREVQGAAEMVILSTCNRTEVYAGVENLREAEERLLQELVEKAGPEIRSSCYRHHGDSAIRHLFRVAAGLDSMVLGETEVFGQLKKAYAHAHAEGSTGCLLNQVFQEAFRAGKKVRSETAITRGATSVGAVAVELAERAFGGLKKCRAMVIGAGETSRITAKSLLSRGVRSMIVSNRSLERAQELAAEIGGQAIQFDRWEDELARTDIVLSSTAAPSAIIKPQHIESIRRKRRHRPLFLIDMAVPRDVDPAVHELDEVYLYDMDGLEAIARESRRKRKAEVRRCEALIEEMILALQERPSAPSPSLREVGS
ncbi:MAG: glutamyl-tRNA reductase [Verrucomicrobiota bacterium]